MQYEIPDGGYRNRKLVHLFLALLFVTLGNSTPFPPDTTMAASSRTRTSGPILPSTSGYNLQRTISDSGRFCSSTIASSSSFGSQSSRFNESSTGFLRKSNNLSSSSVRFPIERPISPKRSFSASSRNHVVKNNNATNSLTSKKTCLCSPSTHPGSFRCSLHKNTSNQSVSYSSNQRLNARRSAMTNSLVRIGTVEGDLVKRALATLIRPSSHHQRRRAGFQPRPSRLSVMSKTEDLNV